MKSGAMSPTVWLFLGWAAIGLLAHPPAASAGEGERDRLQGDLTPLGGERAGNAEGTIPAWGGGHVALVPGYRSGDPRPDPFAGEKPRLRITAANRAQHA